MRLKDINILKKSILKPIIIYADKCRCSYLKTNFKSIIFITKYIEILM